MAIPEKPNFKDQAYDSLKEMSVDQLDELLLEIEGMHPGNGLGQQSEELLRNIEL